MTIAERRPIPQARPDGPKPRHWPIRSTMDGCPILYCICDNLMTVVSPTPDGRRRLYQHIARHTFGWWRLKFYGQRRKQEENEPTGARRSDCVTSQVVPGHFMIHWRAFGAWPDNPKWKGVECQCGARWATESVDGKTTGQQPRVVAALHRRVVIAALCGLNLSDQEALDAELRRREREEKVQ